jgi:DNA-binding CsgD family transcriptional regulator
VTASRWLALPLTKAADVDVCNSLNLLFIGIDQSTSPLFLLDLQGAVAHANPAAEDMLGRNTVLRVSQGRLTLRRREESTAFRRAMLAAVAAAATTLRPDPSLVMLRDRESRVIMGLLLRPLTLPGSPTMLIVRVADMLTPAEASHLWLMRIFGFTTAEAKVGRGLLYGLDLKAIAENEGSALQTVRGHVKRGMAKVGARSQAQFVRLLVNFYNTLVVPPA